MNKIVRSMMQAHAPTRIEGDTDEDWKQVDARIARLVRMSHLDIYQKQDEFEERIQKEIKERTNKMMTEIDKDHDEHLSRDEFATLVKAHIVYAARSEECNVGISTSG